MICQICNTEFQSLKGLHIHIPKKHRVVIENYYPKYFPRVDFYTKEPIIFKDTEDYFQRDFNTKENFAAWCKNHNQEEVRTYILNAFKNRATRKETNLVPSHLELKSLFLPSWFGLVDIFGGVRATISAFAPTGLKFKFNYLDHPKYSNIAPNILIDTREQNPLRFSNSKTMKLSCGDYGTSGELYADVFIERKSLSDLAGTLSGGKSRFLSEIQRSKELGYYLIVLVEDTFLNAIELKPTNGIKRVVNGKYLFYQIRDIMSQFDNIQFLFSGSREISMRWIPRIFQMKEQVKQFDLEYLKDFKLL